MSLPGSANTSWGLLQSERVQWFTIGLRVLSCVPLASSFDRIFICVRWVLIFMGVYLPGGCHNYIDGLVQERCNSIAYALELCITCTNPSVSLLQQSWICFICSNAVLDFSDSWLSCRYHVVHVPSLSKMTLQCDISHWQGACTEWSLHIAL